MIGFYLYGRFFLPTYHSPGSRKEFNLMFHCKRLGALTVALAMTVSLLAGCGGGDTGSGSSSGSSSQGDSSTQTVTIDLSQVTDPYLTTSGLAGDTVVARVGDYDITAAELLYWINYGTSLYLSQFGGYLTTPVWDTDLGDGITMADQMKQSSLEAAAFYTLLPVIGREEGLSPASTIQDDLQQQMDEMLAELGSQELVDHVMWYQMLTEDLYLQLNQQADLHMQLQELYFGENSDNYPTDAEVLAYAQDELGVYRAKHILLSTIDQETQEPLDEATIAEKKALADDLLAQLRAADDPIALFDELMNEYSEDPGLTAYPDGYTTSSGQMVPEFEQAALALQDGEISDVVESDYGYHIILRLPLDPADYRDQVVAQRMQVLSDGWIEEYGLETTEAYDELDIASFWDSMVALQTAVQAELQETTADQDGGNSSSGNSSSGSSSSAS